MAGATGDLRLSELLLGARRGPTQRQRARLDAAAPGRLQRPAARSRGMLIEAGGRTDVSARGDGGTPLIVALFWGHREVTELLAAARRDPRNLRAAAGLGAWT